MIRRPPDDDTKDEDPQSAANADLSPPPRTPDIVEVALFIIPGPLKPGATVIDVRRANRRSMSDFEFPAAAPPADSALAELPLHAEAAEPGGEIADVLSEGAAAQAFVDQLLYAHHSDQAADAPLGERPAVAAASRTAAMRAAVEAGRRLLPAAASALRPLWAKTQDLWSRASLHAEHLRSRASALRPSWPTTQQLRSRASLETEQLASALQPLWAKTQGLWSRASVHAEHLRSRASALRPSWPTTQQLRSRASLEAEQLASALRPVWAKTQDLWSRASAHAEHLSSRTSALRPSWPTTQQLRSRASLEAEQLVSALRPVWAKTQDLWSRAALQAAHLRSRAWALRPTRQLWPKTQQLWSRASLDAGHLASALRPLWAKTQLLWSQASIGARHIWSRASLVAGRARSHASRETAHVWSQARLKTGDASSRAWHKAERAAFRATAQLSAWRAAHVRPTAWSVPTPHQVRVGLMATTAAALAFAVARVDPTPGVEVPRDRLHPSLVEWVRAGGFGMLESRTLAPMTRLAASVGEAPSRAARSSPVAGGAELRVADVRRQPTDGTRMVERRTLREADVPRAERSITPQESKAASVAALRGTTGLTTPASDRPLFTAAPADVAAARVPPLDTPTSEVSRADLRSPDKPSSARVATASPRGDRDAIVDALRHLEVAYERRDADLAKAIWPTVNERALARAFDGLRSQSVAFDLCRVSVSGAAGEAECRGTTTYVPRVGSRYERTESRQWMFRLKKGDDSWLITSAAAR